MSTIALTYSPVVGPSSGSVNATRAAQNDTQLLARLTGLFFLLTYATSIPPVLTLYVPALSDPTFVLGGARDMGLTWGAILEMLLILFNIASAVAIYPVAKRGPELAVLQHVGVVVESRPVPCIEANDEEALIDGEDARVERDDHQIEQCRRHQQVGKGTTQRGVATFQQCGTTRGG